MAQNMTSPVATYGALDPNFSPSDTPGHSGVAHALMDNEYMDVLLAKAAFGSLTERQRDRLSVNDKQRWIISKIEDGSASTTDVLPVAVSQAGAPTTEVHPYGTVWKNTTTNDVYQTTGDGNWLQVA